MLLEEITRHYKQKLLIMNVTIAYYHSFLNGKTDKAMEVKNCSLQNTKYTKTSLFLFIKLFNMHKNNEK